MIDMGDLDGARIVQTTGQSGNPFDSHYGDLITSGRPAGTVPLPFSPATVEASAAQPLTLTPPSRQGAPYSLTGSGPSGTSMKIRPSSTTTG